MATENPNGEPDEHVRSFDLLDLVLPRLASGERNATTAHTASGGKLYRQSVEHGDHLLIRSHRGKVNRCLLCDFVRVCNPIGGQGTLAIVRAFGEGHHGKGLIVQSLGHIRLRCLRRRFRRGYVSIIQAPPNIASIEHVQDHFFLKVVESVMISGCYVDPDLVFFC